MDVIILPGLDGTGDMLADFAAHLGEVHNVHVVSYPKNEALNYDNLSKLVSADLPTDTPYCLLAESFSGPIATRLAAEKPRGLQAVVFAASFVKKPSYFPTAFASFANLTPANSPTLLKLATPITFGKWSTKELNALLVKSVRAVSSRVLAYRIREAMGADELWRFTGLDVPMLYIRPSHDRLVSSSAAKEMNRLNPALCVVDVEGPHFILQAKPAECSAIVADFLDSTLQR
ncbi:MAG: alpha/beta hydrolase [Pseudomonadota bacterium]